MAKQTKSAAPGGGRVPSESQIVRKAKKAFNGCRTVLDRSLCVDLYRFKTHKDTDHWVRAKKKCAKAAGYGWTCEALFECLARVGGGTLPLMIIGLIVPSKLEKMRYDDALQILSGKKFEVMDDANFSKIKKLSWEDMSRIQQSWLIGTNGRILPPDLQIRAATPKEIFWDAEGMKVMKDEVHVWYYNRRFRKVITVIPKSLWKEAFKKGNLNKEILRNDAA